MLSRRSQHIVELLGMCAPTGTFPFPFLEAEHFLSAIRISFSVVEHCSSPQFDRTAAWRSKEHAEFQLVVVCVHVVSGTTRVQPRVRAFGNFWLQTSRARGVVGGNWTLTNFTTSSKTSPVSVGHLQCSETSLTPTRGLDFLRWCDHLSLNFEWDAWNQSPEIWFTTHLKKNPSQKVAPPLHSRDLSSEHWSSEGLFWPLSPTHLSGKLRKPFRISLKLLVFFCD